jgi:hypothetical protein
MKATSIKTGVIRKYIGERREHVEGPTIRRELSVLRSMFRLAVREKALSSDQVAYFRRLPRGGPIHHPRAVRTDSKFPAGWFPTPIEERWSEVFSRPAPILHIFVCHGVPFGRGDEHHLEKCQ